MKPLSALGVALVLLTYTLPAFGWDKKGIVLLLPLLNGLHQGDGGLVRLLAIAGLGTAMELTLKGPACRRAASSSFAQRFLLSARAIY